MDDLTKARYFGLSVEFTPDLSNVDQLTTIMCYVSPDNGESVERFLTFLTIKKYAGDELASKVLSWQIQRYATKVKTAKKELAVFVACSAQYLNLVRKAAVGLCLETVSSFILFQKLYVFSWFYRLLEIIRKNYLQLSLLKKKLADYVLILKKRLMPLTKEEFFRQAFELAEKLNFSHPINKNTKMAGNNFYINFLKRNPKISLQKPQSTILARAVGFNKPQVQRFYSQLEELNSKYNFTVSHIFIWGKTRITNVHDKSMVWTIKTSKSNKKERKIKKNLQKNNRRNAFYQQKWKRGQWTLRRWKIKYHFP